MLRRPSAVPESGNLDISVYAPPWTNGFLDHDRKAARNYPRSDYALRAKKKKRSDGIDLGGEGVIIRLGVTKGRQARRNIPPQKAN